MSVCAVHRDLPAERVLLALPEREIHLWIADYGEIGSPLLHAAYRRLLNQSERLQETRFYFARDRLRYLVTRALVRTVLSRYAAVCPEDWIFSTNAYGRPDIANAGALRLRLSFNISHTHSLIVLAIATARAVGVDVENIRARSALLSIAHRYFAEGEVASLAALPSEQQPYRFLEYWTFKEAYIKARGMGLALPLDRFSFHFPAPDAVSFETDPGLGDAATRWQLWQVRPAPNYLVALCGERLADIDARLVVREVVPLQTARVVAAGVLRTSSQT